jgi:hypothetical protein
MDYLHKASEPWGNDSPTLLRSELENSYKTAGRSALELQLPSSNPICSPPSCHKMQLPGSFYALAIFCASALVRISLSQIVLVVAHGVQNRVRRLVPKTVW